MSGDPNMLPSNPVERVSLFGAEHVRLSRQLTQLHEVIADMERLDSLTPDAVAALEKYRENETRITLERARIEFETGKLLGGEPEAVLEWDRLHAGDPSHDAVATPDEPLHAP